MWTEATARQRPTRVATARAKPAAARDAGVGGAGRAPLTPLGGHGKRLTACVHVHSLTGTRTLGLR